MQSTTLAQQFAAKHSKGVVTGAIWTVRIVRWSATAIMAAAMASNYHHQVIYLGGHVDTVTAHIAPVALDLLTVLCARILASVVMDAVSKSAAIRALWFPVLASAALSAAAPGDLISKLVFAGMVGLIPIAEYVASHVKINFKALEAAEVENAPVEIVEDAPAPTVKVRVTEAEKAARKRAGYDDMEKATKAAWSKKYRARIARQQEATAPTSPGRVPVDAPAAAELDALVR